MFSVLMQLVRCRGPGQTVLFWCHYGLSCSGVIMAETEPPGALPLPKRAETRQVNLAGWGQHTARPLRDRWVFFVGVYKLLRKASTSQQ